MDQLLKLLSHRCVISPFVLKLLFPHETCVLFVIYPPCTCYNMRWSHIQGSNVHDNFDISDVVDETNMLLWNFRHQWPSTAVLYLKRIDTSSSLQKPKHSYSWNFSDIFFFFIRQSTLNFSSTVSSMFQHSNRTVIADMVQIESHWVVTWKFWIIQSCNITFF